MGEQGDALFRRCTSTKLALPLRKREEIQEVLYGKRAEEAFPRSGVPKAGAPKTLKAHPRLPADESFETD